MSDRIKEKINKIKERLFMQQQTSDINDNNAFNYEKAHCKFINQIEENLRL